MRVLITAEGKHTANHPFTHRMVVDLRSTLIDFTGMQNSAVDPSSLTDPTVKCVTWGPAVENGVAFERGVIERVDGHKTTFPDKNILTPYLDAFEQRMFDLAHEQAHFEIAQQFDQAHDEAHRVNALLEQHKLDAAWDAAHTENEERTRLAREAEAKAAAEQSDEQS